MPIRQSENDRRLMEALVSQSLVIQCKNWIAVASLWAKPTLNIVASLKASYNTQNQIWFLSSMKNVHYIHIHIYTQSRAPPTVSSYQLSVCKLRCTPTLGVIANFCTTLPNVVCYQY